MWMASVDLTPNTDTSNQGSPIKIVWLCLIKAVYVEESINYTLLGTPVIGSAHLTC